MTRIFVYGSLMAGFGNNKLLDTAKFIGEGLTSQTYTMISLGSFPGVLKGGSTSIKGEVYEVDFYTLHRLDQLEGHPNWYKREPIKLEDGSTVEMYIYPEQGRGLPEVKSGSWRAFRTVREL